MSGFDHRYRWRAALAISLLLLRANAAEEPSAPVRSNSQPKLATPPMVPEMPPPIPTISNRPPVALFRDLLEASRSERLKLLADRSPEAQKLILAKVKEYEQLPGDERQLRLRVTELRYYLWPLMNLPATNRAARLRFVPEDLRKSVEDRLRKWDRLAPDLQAELKENQAFVQWFTESASGASVSFTNMSALRAEQLKRGLERWLALPEDEHRRIIESFDQIFRITPEERDKVFSTLSEAEHKKIERTLAEYKGLSPEQRSQCLLALDKFASLSIEGRRQFFRNVDQWKQMTPSQRQEWRNVVQRISMEPPLPRDMDLPLLPPSPRVRVSQRPAAPPLATNGP
jgi:hypothetical protein